LSKSRKNNLLVKTLRTLELAKPYQLIKGRHGWFLVNPDDVYLGRAITHYGEYGEIEWLVIEQLMRPGRDAVEVGANIGTHTVSMARTLAGMGRQLLAVEPQPVVFQNLCANIALNGIFNVLAENAACSDKPGWLSFQSYDLAGEINSGGVSMREDGAGNQRVRSLRLDDLIPPHFQVGLIKIDVDGYEGKVLQGGMRTFAKHRPAIMLELHKDELIRFGETRRDVVGRLFGIGYKAMFMTDHHVPKACRVVSVDLDHPLVARQETDFLLFC